MEKTMSQAEIERLFADEPAGATAVMDDFPDGIRAAVTGAKESATVTAAAAIPEILKILSTVDGKFHPSIFAAVTAIQRTAAGDSVTAIGDQLNELASRRSRETRANGKQRRRWWGR
ncbi:MAG: hypothetical protein C4527_15115 [Candidatus Omnitrophota bacterium]|jgi:hypothetical protein|nr:MAG: hypothetical protein C4527_15115 [Candidatus Omnitrophota bacterium]